MFLDTETTGLGDDAQIVEVAVIDRNGEVLLSTFVQPTGGIPAEATRLHGIQDVDVLDAPTWPEVYPLVARILDRYSPVVIYNADFDVRVLNQLNRLHGLPEFQADWQCAMKQFAAFIGEWHPRYQNFRWHSLANAMRAVGQISPARDHRALIDAESCRRVVEAMESGVRADIPAIRPDVIERDPEARWASETRTIPGGQVTVVSSSGGCSMGLLLVILFVGTACILLGCCAFFYAMMVTS